MVLSDIKVKLDPLLNKLSFEIADETKKHNLAKYNQLVMVRLREIIGNPRKNPIMSYDEAIKYYFEKGKKNIEKKYLLIVNLQAYICTKLSFPFIYDKFLICKILQITQKTYNDIIMDSKTGINSRDETVCNVFLDIDTMLLTDRNNGAEAGILNAKAVDNVNKYEEIYGGYGVQVKKQKNVSEKKILVYTQEETEKILNNYSFSNLIEKNKQIS